MFCCTILDVTTAGAKVRLDGPTGGGRPCFGQQLVVTPRGGTPIAAVLRWAKDEVWGVQFLMPITSEMLLKLTSSTMRVIQPRPSRAHIAMPGELTIAHDRRAILLVNLSAGGAMVRIQQPLGVGTALFLTMGDLRPLPAYVRWETGDCAGLMFNRLLPVDVARHIATACNTHPGWLADVIQQHGAVQ